MPDLIDYQRGSSQKERDAERQRRTAQRDELIWRIGLTVAVGGFLLAFLLILFVGLALSTQ